MTTSRASARKRPKSTTAELVATVRASHLRWDDAPIFTDSYARQMLSPFWRAVATYRPLNWLVGDVIMGAYRPIHPSIVLRIRYSEDQLMEAVKAGASQYVILGAGYDTFALRHKELADQVRVFEVDHPATQDVKRQRILEANGEVPPNLTFVPVDFESDRLNEELARAGFDQQAPAFFSWLGVTYYLTLEAIGDTLACIAAMAAPGSRLVFDYKIARQMMPEEWKTLTGKLERFVARLGEPMLSNFAPETLRDTMSMHGFKEVELLTPEEQQLRYLSGRSDIAPADCFHFAQFALEPPDEEASA